MVVVRRYVQLYLDATYSATLATFKPKREIARKIVEQYLATPKESETEA